MIRTLFVMNPLLMLLMVFLLGGMDGFGRRYLYSVLIGECVSLTCYVFSAGVRLIGSRFFKSALQRRTEILAAVVGMFPGLWIGFTLTGAVARAIGNSWETPGFLDYSMGLTIGTLFFGIIVLIDLYSSARSRVQRLETETLRAKLSALTVQMNPHLLFNALNTIASTISSDPQAAEETTLKLSELYRGLLNSSKSATHSLSKELEICRAYLGVESARFGKRLHWSIECEPALASFEIPVLLIQTLVENAIKHGFSQRAAGGKVEIKIASTDSKDPSFKITVNDDGVGFGKSSSKNGTGTGVSSCRARLELLYGGEAQFEIGERTEGGTRVEIRIPAKVVVQ